MVQIWYRHVVSVLVYIVQIWSGHVVQIFAWVAWFFVDIGWIAM